MKHQKNTALSRKNQKKDHLVNRKLENDRGSIWKRTKPRRTNLKNDNSVNRRNLKKDNREKENLKKDNSGKERSEE